MAAATNTILLTGPTFQQVQSTQVLVTPTGGVLTTLADALAPGAINGTVIGNITPAAGTFTVLNVTEQQTFTASSGALWAVNGAYGGTVSLAPGSTYPLAAINLLGETVTSLGAATLVAALSVQHSFSGGEAARAGINSFITNTGPTAHSGVGGGHAFYSALGGTNYIASSDGGSIGNYLGDFFGVGTIVQTTPSATFLHGVIGAEFDVSVVTGASVAQKVGLQVATVNNDAVQGTPSSSGGADMAISVFGDPTTTIGWRTGLCFGRAGTFFNISGTIIGWEPYSNNPAGGTWVSSGGRPTPQKGIDFSGINFSVNMLSLGGTLAQPAFVVDRNGSTTINAPFAAFTLNDTTSSVTHGGLVRVTGIGASPDQYLWEINTAVAGDFSTAVTALAINAVGQVVFPGNIGVGGFGSVTPVGSLEVLSTTNVAPRGIVGTQYSGNTAGAMLQLRKSRSVTPGSFSAAHSGDVLGTIGFAGDTGSAFSGPSASITAIAEEAFTPTANGTKLTFSTVADGTATNAIRVMITGGGDVVLNNGPLSALNVTAGFTFPAFTNATSGAGGIPTGTPATNSPAMSWNDVTQTLNVYSPAAAGWRHIASAAGAG